MLVALSLVPLAIAVVVWIVVPGAFFGLVAYRRRKGL